MAHSFINFRAQSSMFRDADVFLISGLLRSAGKNELTPELRPVIDTWFFGYDEFPSGAIDLQLDAHLTSQVAYESIIHSIDAVVNTLNAQGSTLSGEWLSEVLNDGEAVEYKDRLTVEVIEIINKFKSLLAETK